MIDCKGADLPGGLSFGNGHEFLVAACSCSSRLCEQHTKQCCGRLAPTGTGRISERSSDIYRFHNLSRSASAVYSICVCCCYCECWHWTKAMAQIRHPKDLRLSLDGIDLSCCSFCIPALRSVLSFVYSSLVRLLYIDNTMTRPRFNSARCST